MGEENEDQSRPGRPTVAVVGVHGVADQNPEDTAEALADLLLGLTAQDAPRYTSFRREPVRIPTRKLFVGDAKVDETQTGQLFNERPSFILVDQRRVDPGPAETPKEPPDDVGERTTLEADHKFMRAQLRDYRGGAPAYDTVRLSGHKLANGSGDVAADIHIYEMYWADLSRLSGGLLRILGALYQLLLHLANMGLQVVDHAQQAESERGVWPCWSHAMAVRLIGVFFAPWFLVTLIVALMAVGAGIDLGEYGSYKSEGATALGAVGVSGGVGALVYRWNRAPAVALPLTLVAGSITGWLCFIWTGAAPGHAEIALAIEWLLVAGAGYAVIIHRHGQRRPGALPVGLGLYALMLLFALPLLLTGEPSRVRIVDVSLWLLEGLLLFAVFPYLVLILCAWLSAATGLNAARKATGDDKKRAHRTAWTSRATLAIAACGLIMVSLLLAAALVAASRTTLSEADQHTALLGFLPWVETTSQARFAEELLGFAATSGFIPLGLCVLFAALLVAWALLPVVRAEVWAPENASDDDSERLGRWLTGGHKLLVVAAEVIFVGVFLASPVVTVLSVTYKWGLHPIPVDLLPESRATLMVIGGLVAASSVGFVALKGRLENLALGFRPVLDVALDVDNYLREHPRGKTARACIAERYVSLLRYLSCYRLPNGSSYAAVVFVAHSQGSVITADLLRFLRREPHLEVAKAVEQTPPLYLFTMGSPLRQLYGGAFPHLYRWATQPDSNKPEYERKEPERRRDETGHIVTDCLPACAPDPDSLGIEAWVNAYRSGDYVGRALWRAVDHPVMYRRTTAPSDEDTIEVSEDSDRKRRELCIGAGAHTHYWDPGTMAIAEELDLLVERALADSQP